jgi:hypothetical protein
MASTVDSTKTIYIIVHGQKQLLDQVRQKLVLKGFENEKMQNASLDKAGSAGEYIAMVWPPIAPKEIVVNQIIGSSGTGKRDDVSRGIGVWGSVVQKELYRMPLNSRNMLVLQ